MDLRFSTQLRWNIGMVGGSIQIIPKDLKDTLYSFPLNLTVFPQSDIPQDLATLDHLNSPLSGRVA